MNIEAKGSTQGSFCLLGLTDKTSFVLNILLRCSSFFRYENRLEIISPKLVEFQRWHYQGLQATETERD